MKLFNTFTSQNASTSLLTYLLTYNRNHKYFMSFDEFLYCNKFYISKCEYIFCGTANKNNAKCLF